MVAAIKENTGNQAVAKEIIVELPEIKVSVLAVESFCWTILVTVNEWFLC